MGRLIDETDLKNLLYVLDDARYDLYYAIKKIPELPTVEAIPKADYEARLKADLVAMLTEIQLEIKEIEVAKENTEIRAGECCMKGVCIDLIQQKIDKLMGE